MQNNSAKGEKNNEPEFSKQRHEMSIVVAVLRLKKSTSDFHFYFRSSNNIFTSQTFNLLGSLSSMECKRKHNVDAILTSKHMHIQCCDTLYFT